MNIYICEKIFYPTDSRCKFEDLSKLISDATYKNRCTLVLNPKVLYGEFYKQMDGKKQELIRSIVTQTGNSCPEPDCYITPDGDSVNDLKFFNVTEGIVYINAPLEIVVENSLNDSYFYRVLFKAFQTDIILEEYENLNWVSFGNAGGCDNIPKFIEGKLKSNGQKSKMLKHYVLLDSDKRFPEDESKHQTVISYLKEKNVPYHILEKRMMENYLPDKAFDTFRNKENEDWLDCYLHLSPHQKDYLDIYKGLESDIAKQYKGNSIGCREHLHEKIKLLYETISDRQFEILLKGMHLKDFKTSFPKAFESYHVFRDSLLQRTSHQKEPNELEYIVLDILKLI